YVYGDALFMHLTYENYSTSGYLDSLANWMNTQVKANPTVKWKIAVYHKTMYTGSSSHQSDSDGKTVRLKMGPVFDSLKIDLALQGHDHIYEIMGPIKNVTLIPGAVSNQTIVTTTIRDNVTGKLGGTFEVKQGTLYFLNNSAGRKKYEPRSQAQMAAVEAGLGVTNYFGMFSGRFGQTGEPTFSNITISTDSINISTYTVDSVGNSTLFDAFKVVKTTPIDSILQVVSTFNQADYTVPSWTLFLRAQKALIANKDSANYANMLTTLAKMKPSSMPYNIVMNLNKDPKTKMAFNWFTNAGVTGGQVQIVAGNATDTLAFATPFMVVNARCDSAKNLNYNVSANGLLALTGLPNNTKMSYMFNKALAEGLTPNTQYSYRVGKNGAWSEIGTFKTAKATKEPFSFVYFTDPQANTDAMFYISQKTTHAAQTMYPNTNFWLSCGDLIETSGTNNSEWEYEQFFETQQDIFMKNPFVTVEGNHDISSNKNFTYHMNTDSVAFDYAKATVPGSVYSFVYGDALFMALTYENYSTAGYLDSLANWMNTQVKAHPEVKWRIAFYHKTMYTGSGSHQSDSDGKTVRLKMGPVFDSLKIDLALQGHDHIYEVMGPIKNITLIPNAVSNQQIVTATPRENVTGLLGGTFNTKQGTLYFLNNSGGRKKYEPRSQAQMAAVEAGLGVTNYFGMFTGRFGQTGEPTFSNITVSTDTITISTYTVDSVGNSTLFDAFKVVKSAQDNTWNGNSGNNWDKASNWSEGLTPTQDQNVIIPTNLANYPTVSSPVIINNLTVQSDSTGTASLLDNSLLTINGNSTIKCYISGNKWHMISIPVQSSTSSAFYLGTGQASIYAKGFSNGSWTSLITNSTTPLLPLKGYAVWADTQTNSTPNPTLTFTGALNTASQTLPTEAGWNFIGNPFVSAIDWNTLNLTNVNGQAVRVWNQTLQLYSTYSAIGGSVNGGNQYLSPMQAFFVKGMNTDGVVFSNANRIHNLQPLQKSTNSTISNLLKVKAQKGTYTDEINVVYNTIATNGYDALYDANKLFVTDNNIPQIYSIANNNELSINVFGSLPAAIPLNIRLGVAGNINLTASDINSFDANISIKLEDISTGNIQDLRQNPIYSFNGTIGENANRFVIHFMMLPNSIKETNNTSNTSIYSYENTVYVNSAEVIKTIEVYNMLGQLIKSKVGNNNKINSLNLEHSTAYYLVKVITDKAIYTKKVFIK
ncbi:MAG: metallophosphoesterase, partial [Bacteroidales bacterium]